MTRFLNIFLFASVVFASLGGCASTSFAPPPVNLTNVMETRGSNLSWSQSCRSFEKRDDDRNVIPIGQTVNGARALIENFVLLYRCRAHSAANGRQIFEVPSFLTAVGTVTAAAFGAPPDVSIAGGAATSILNGGKNYYNPKQKADIFDGALDALLCIKLEAIGIDAFDVKALDAAKRSSGQKILNFRNDSEVVVSPEAQYFDLIAGSLYSVERVLAQRLSNVGTFDPAGVVAEIEQLSKKNEEASGQQAQTNAAAKAGVLGLSGDEKKVAANAIVAINALQPKLQRCVVRAKL